MLLKPIMFVLHTWDPQHRALWCILLVVLFAIAIRNQSASDTSFDPDKPSPGLPWYLSKGCSWRVLKGNYGYRMQARALCFDHRHDVSLLLHHGRLSELTVASRVLMIVYLAYSIYPAFPRKPKAERRERQTDIELKQAWASIGPRCRSDTWKRNGKEPTSLPELTQDAEYAAWQDEPQTPRTTFSALTGEQQLGQCSSICLERRV